MTMKFCPNCKTPLKYTKFEARDLAYCSCGHYEFPKHGLISDEKMPAKVKLGKGVAKKSRSNKGRDFPHTCSKCKHDGCEVIDLGVSYSDESSRILYICAKCNHVDRQADGTGNN